jgi:opacity protein-like surface antigen
MHFRTLAALALAAFVTLAAPKTASADWMFTPFIGAAMGGSTADTTTSFGAGLTWMGAGAVGFDVDFGYTPDFFGDSGDDFGDNNVTTLMVNAIVGAPIGGQSGPGFRPYGVGGIGLYREQIDDAGDLFDVDDNSFGFNLGGGIAGFFTDNIGLRGDLRYFRSLRGDGDEDDLDVDLGDSDFWRATVGVTFRFGG